MLPGVQGIYKDAPRYLCVQLTLYITASLGNLKLLAQESFNVNVKSYLHKAGDVVVGVIGSRGPVEISMAQGRRLVPFNLTPRMEAATVQWRLSINVQQVCHVPLGSDRG